MRKILLSVFSFIVGATVIVKEMNKIIGEKQMEKEKFRIMYQMMERWVRIKQRGGSLQPYFETHGYKEIAVYGMGDIGKRLIQELNGSEISVKYGIDRNISLGSEVKIVAPDEATEKVDVIVVTAIAYFGEVYKLLSGKLSSPIVSLEDIVYEVG